MQPIVMAKLKQIIVPFIAGAIGLFFYITRFPEKVFKAGSVDIVGASHQVIPAYPIHAYRTPLLNRDWCKKNWTGLDSTIKMDNFSIF